MLISLITLPSATSTIASVGDQSSPWFTELLPIVLAIVGIEVGVLIVGFLGGVIVSSIFGLADRFTHRNK